MAMASPILPSSPYRSTSSPSRTASAEAFPVLYPSQMSFGASLAQRARSRGAVPPPLKIPSNPAPPSWEERSPAHSTHPSPTPSLKVSSKSSPTPSPTPSPLRTPAGWSPLRFVGLFRAAVDEQSYNKSVTRAEFRSGKESEVPDVARKLQKRRPSLSEGRDPGYPPRPESPKDGTRERGKRRPVPLTPYHREFDDLPFKRDNTPSPSPIAMPIPKRHISSSDQWSREGLPRISSRARSASLVLDAQPAQIHPAPAKRSNTTTPRPLTSSLRRAGSASSHSSSRPGRKRSRSVSFLLPVEQLRPDDNILPLPRAQTPHRTPIQPSHPNLLNTDVDYFSIPLSSPSTPASKSHAEVRDRPNQAIDDAAHHHVLYLKCNDEPREEGRCSKVASTRKGFFNRRGDQLVDNDGKRALAKDPYPLDLASYPRWAWQDEKGRCIEYSTHTFIEYGSIRWKEVMGLD